MEEKARILIVDDDKSLSKSLSLVLEKKGYCRLWAGTGKEALAKAKESAFNVALIDIRLPDADGIKLAALLKETHPETEVIIVTGYASLDSSTQALAKGVDAYLIKPLNMDEVLQRVRDILTRQRLLEEKQQAEQALRQKKEQQEILLSSIPAFIYFKDSALKLIAANKAFAEMVHTPIDQLPGKDARELFPKEEAEKFHIDDRKVMESGKAMMNIEEEFTDAEGEKRWASSSKIPYFEESGEVAGMVGITVDITERKQTEERIRHRNVVLRAIRNVNQLIVGERDRDKLIKGICENLTATRGYHNAWIVLLDESNKLVNATERCLGDDFQPILDRLKSGELTSCVRKALEKPGVIVIEDPSSTCVNCPLSKSCGSLGTLTVRLEHGGTVYGLLGSSIPLDLIVDEEEEGLFGEIAQDISFGLHDMQMEEVGDRAKEQVVAYQQQLRLLASQLSLGEERARRRIAAALHDQVGESLFVINMKLGALREDLIRSDHVEHLDEIRELIGKLSGTTRSLTFDLAAPVLYELGLEAAVEWLAENIHDKYDILIEFQHDDQPKPLDEDVQVCLFRAVHELLVNVAKHAQTRSAKVSMWREGNEVHIVAEDDGVGFNLSELLTPKGRIRGFGLFNIRERLESFGGHAELESEQGHGTRVTLVQPLKPQGETSEGLM